MPFLDPQKKKACALRWYYKNREHCLEQKAKWRSKNIDKVRANGRAYAKLAYPKRKDKILKYNEKYYAKNRSYWQQYYQKNREKMKDQSHTARKANWPRFLARAAARRARKRLITVGDLTDLAMIYERCKELRQWFDVAVDHIVPLDKGGTHEPSNLQIIYSVENLRKGTKIDYKPKVIFK